MIDDLRHFDADDYEGDFLRAGKDAIVFAACAVALLLALVLV